MRSGRKFSMPFAELAQRGDRVSVLIDRDLEHFSSLGYPENQSEFIQVKTDEFKQILPDMYYEGQQMLKTEAKNHKREEIQGLLGELRFRAKLALGEDNTKFRLFRFSSLTRQDDKQMVTYAKHVVQTAQGMLPELAVRRVDKNMLDAIWKVALELDDAIDVQKEFISLREQKRVERIAKGNELYDLIVEACEVGKRIWEHKNQAHYDDYVLYGSSKTAEVEAGEKEETVVSETEN